ncbi:MAG: hypothetical protein JSR19_05100 [Proteobacteria bacterium]|nr:hypothetical protein [Pseudomonadota bacterium]HQR03652.1 hypothetical protein [Rhodocyclaceae bacterium]
MTTVRTDIFRIIPTLFFRFTTQALMPQTHAAGSGNPSIHQGLHFSGNFLQSVLLALLRVEGSLLEVHLGCTR